MRHILPCTLVISIFTSAPAAYSDDAVKDEKPQESTHATETYRLALREAATYEFYRDPDRTTKLKLRPRSILRWSNPVSGQLYGDVFIWTSQGRPEVIASIFKWYSPHRHMGVEFQSLSQRKLVADRDGSQVWAPLKAGVELKPIPGAKTPSKSPVTRLRQMRVLAAQFSASATDRNREDRKEILRLLSQPIYRYNNESTKPLDGALFAFVQGTNPEVILMIESVATPNGRRWYYGLGRQNSVRLDVSHQNKNIWTVPKIAPPWENVRDRSKAYTGFRRVFVEDDSR